MTKGTMADNRNHYNNLLAMMNLPMFDNTKGIEETRARLQANVDHWNKALERK